MRRLRTLLLSLAILALHASARADSAPDVVADEQCFPQTGACVRAPFLGYWLANGGVPIYGLPLFDAGFEVLEDGQLHLVQYFERARLEYHPANNPPHDILLGQFGRLLHPADPPVAARVGMAYFAETGHNVAPDFSDFWQANGGLAQFGYPLGEEFSETLEDGRAYTVQYFERARFERHPEHAPPHGIQLGHFGRLFYNRSLLSPRDEPTMCQSADLLVSETHGGAGGSTYVMVTLQNQGGGPCSLSGFLRPGLLDASGAELPVFERYQPAFIGAQAQSPFVLQPGQAAQSVLKWANNCPTGGEIDPDPAAALTFTLPNGEGWWSFPISGPRCGATGHAKAIGSYALSLVFEGPANAAFRTLDAYFASISHGRYREAFGMLSPEMQTQLGPYDQFAAGFATTRVVSFAVVGYAPLDAQTARMSVRIAAWQTDGTARYYTGSYDVTALVNATTYPDGRIVAADIAEEFP